MNIGLKLNEFFDNRAKRVTLLQLRKMSERQLLDCGVSPALLREGVKAWPWRELEDVPLVPRLSSLPAVMTNVVENPEIAVAYVAAEKAAA